MSLAACAQACRAEVCAGAVAAAGLRHVAVGVRYLPQMSEQDHRHLYVATVPTRGGSLCASARTTASAHEFLRDLGQPGPRTITRVSTGNGKEATDHRAALRRIPQATTISPPRAHRGIEHRLAWLGRSIRRPMAGSNASTAGMRMYCKAITSTAAKKPY